MNTVLLSDLSLILNLQTDQYGRPSFGEDQQMLIIGGYVYLFHKLEWSLIIAVIKQVRIYNAMSRPCGGRYFPL